MFANGYKKKVGSAVLVHIILLVGAAIMIIPFIWMFLTSVKTMGESTMVPLVIIPKQLQWNNYLKVFESLPFLTFYWNTMITTLFKTVGQVMICSLAAYAFARIEFPGRNLFFLLALSVLMVPGQVFLIPQYMIMKDLGWLNSLQALIVPGLFSAFGTFLLRQFFMTLPKELEEAAKLDGCNQFRTYWQIMLPLAKPGMIALAIFVILWSWNDLMWPLIVNTSPDKMVLSAGLASLQGEHSTNYTILMAGSMMAIIPMIIIFLVFQRSFIEGIALTGSK
ncbi:carbohydrate ABC transporter permease [Paenibacillus alkaliterrae]|uniref:carbohydrate ABC transporter permease n=1 Tax=Paenibacillus alkaliterrae TaxID=320909 RepID=UPI001F1A71F1|nr:carbohydrate ABC transporter permease [Paenibacillus alkaliterrae]MCF2938662.1 carbohydrate ABC transporter permease [Paenibacillus alkaliterrae]